VLLVTKKLLRTNSQHVKVCLRLRCFSALPSASCSSLLYLSVLLLPLFCLHHNCLNRCEHAHICPYMCMRVLFFGCFVGVCFAIPISIVTISPSLLCTLSSDSLPTHSNEKTNNIKQCHILLMKLNLSHLGHQKSVATQDRWTFRTYCFHRYCTAEGQKQTGRIRQMTVKGK
jgi:hypothetical protein